MAATDLSSSPALPTQSASPENEKQQSQSSTQDEEQQQQEEYLFSCRCDSAKAVSSLLSCLTASSHDKRNTSKTTNIQPVTVFCTPAALTFHVYGTTAKQSQASVDMNKGLFCDYQCTQGEFCVNLTSVLECIHVLGTHLDNTKLCWAYSPSTQTFEMELLEPGGVLSTAAIPGLQPPTAPSKSLALAFSQSPIVSRILVKSEWLKQAWNELEHVPGATVCTVAVSNKALQLATVGHAGECIVSLPCTTANQGSVLLSLECSSTPKKNVPRSYPFSSFALGMRGLEIAQETCVTLNEAGMMAIQHQVLFPGGEDDGEANFVDFLMACLENEQDEKEEENVPPPLSLGWKSQEEEEERQEDSDEDSDDEHQLPLPISAAPLFGSVVAAEGDASVSTNTTTTTNRNVRRRRRRRSVQSSTTASVQQHDSSSSEEDEDDEPLDVTASMTPNRRRRRRRRGGRDLREEGASSPEIGYGKDD